MELRHARYFIAVAESLNFRKAAQQLHVAQPPLSRQVRQLEEYLGVTLLKRDKRKVELTPAGRAFLVEARKLIAQAGHAADVARHAQKGLSATIKVGIASGFGGLVSRFVFEHRRHAPATEIECKDVFSSFQNEALREREIDIGFLRPPVDQLTLDCELLFEEEFVVVLSKNHPLAKRRSLRLKDIAEERLIIFDRKLSSGLYDKVMGLFSRQNLSPRLVPGHVEPHEEAGAIMVASGKAMFVGAGALVNRSVSGVELVSVRLDEPEAQIEVYAAWRKSEGSAAVLAFLDSVRRALGHPVHEIAASA